ncbi:MAG TPA: lipocalin-like domain-containing protein [Oculatellaceae cyanobacterium]|jgi:hypothetical protein
MIKNPLLGSWKLISLQIQMDNGKVDYPFGEDAIGYTIYTDNGYVSFHVMNANRPKYTNEYEPDPEEVVASVDTSMSYWGKYEIVADKVISYPEVSSYPNFVGTTVERFFSELTETTMSIISPDWEEDGIKARYYIIWQRI